MLSLKEMQEHIDSIASAIGKTLAFAVKAFATAVILRGIGQAVGFVRRQIENLLRALGVDIPLTATLNYKKFRSGTRKVMFL